MLPLGFDAHDAIFFPEQPLDSNVLPDVRAGLDGFFEKDLVEHLAGADKAGRHRLVEFFRERDRHLVAVRAAKGHAPRADLLGLHHCVYEAQAAQDVYAFAADRVAADFVPGKGAFVQEEDIETSFRHERRRRRAARPGPYDDGVVGLRSGVRGSEFGVHRGAVRRSRRENIRRWQPR